MTLNHETSRSYPLSRAIYDKLYQCFEQAINTIGIDHFKKCSMFGSNKPMTPWPND